MKPISRILLILVLTLPSFCFGTTLTKLYQFSVSVADQSNNERDRAIEEAFSHLLVKVTGNVTIAESIVGKNLIREAKRYMRLFRYETISAAEARADAPQTRLVVIFDEESTNEAIWARKLPVWGKTRPAVLLWIAVQDNQQRRLLSFEELHPGVEAIKARADYRGLPLVYPLQDLEDQMKVTVDDIWANFHDAVRAASRRYSPESILTGRLIQDGFGQWHARWTLYVDDEPSTWTLSGDSLESVATAGVDGAANSLATRYANVSTGTGENVYFLRIADVRDLPAYVKVQKYVSSLPSVADIQVAQLEPNQVVFKLKLRGQRNGVENAISLGQLLVAQPSNDFSETILSYRLVQ